MTLEEVQREMRLNFEHQIEQCAIGVSEQTGAPLEDCLDVIRKTALENMPPKERLFYGEGRLSLSI